MIPKLPSHLRDRPTLGQEDPRAANLQWFRQAETGLFLHFSPASVLAGGKQAWQAIDSTYQEIHHRFAFTGNIDESVFIGESDYRSGYLVARCEIVTPVEGHLEHFLEIFIIHIFV